MTVARNLTFSITVIAAMVAIVGGVLWLQPDVMGVAGCIAAVAALLWGLIAAIQKVTGEPEPEPEDDGHCHLCDHPFGELKHACLAPADEPLTYRPVSNGELRPVWDAEVGAPE